MIKNTLLKSKLFKHRKQIKIKNINK